MTKEMPIENATLRGLNVASVEHKSGREWGGDDYVVVRFTNGATLYADSPTLYAPTENGRAFSGREGA